MARVLDLDERQRRRSFMFRSAAALLGLFLLWGIGLLWFAAMLPHEVGEPERKTDAIVVLTGGSGRLHQGLELLAAQRAKRLFVSGVYRGVDVEELLSLSKQSPQDLECCVVLGYEADDTRGNAVESAEWMHQEGFTSLRLVTASYHMPRSLLEFGRAMPDIEIVPHPILSANFRQDDWWRWPGSAGLLATEYTKYLVALIRGGAPPKAP